MKTRDASGSGDRWSWSRLLPGRWRDASDRSVEIADGLVLWWTVGMEKAWLAREGEPLMDPAAIPRSPSTTKLTDRDGSEFEVSRQYYPFTASSLSVESPKGLFSVVDHRARSERLISIAALLALLGFGSLISDRGASAPIRDGAYLLAALAPLAALVGLLRQRLWGLWVLSSLVGVYIVGTMGVFAWVQGENLAKVAEFRLQLGVLVLFHLCAPSWIFATWLGAWFSEGRRALPGLAVGETTSALRIPRSGSFSRATATVLLLAVAMLGFSVWAHSRADPWTRTFHQKVVSGDPLPNLGAYAEDLPEPIESFEGPGSSISRIGRRGWICFLPGLELPPHLAAWQQDPTRPFYRADEDALRPLPPITGRVDVHVLDWRRWILLYRDADGRLERVLECRPW